MKQLTDHGIERLCKVFDVKDLNIVSKRELLVHLVESMSREKEALNTINSLLNQLNASIDQKSDLEKLSTSLHVELFCANPDHNRFEDLIPDVRSRLIKERISRMGTPCL